MIRLLRHPSRLAGEFRIRLRCATTRRSTHDDYTVQDNDKGRLSERLRNNPACLLPDAAAKPNNNGFRVCKITLQPQARDVINGLLLLL